MALHPTRTKQAVFRLGDDELVKVGARRHDWRNPYAFALTISWPTFFAAMAVIDIAVNVVFALLFLAGHDPIVNSHPGSLLDAFFFSVETFSTVGYGVMSPNTLYANLVATGDIFCGIAFTALFTGLIFVRFSKPRAEMVYAANPIVSIHDGKPMLMIRFASDTTRMMTGATARLDVLLLRHSAEGRAYRQAFGLPLKRSFIPVMLLAWTVMHELDESSPLYGMTSDDLIENDARLLLTIEVRDHALGVQVVDFKTYDATQVRFGVAYQDITEYRRGCTEVDLRRISNVEPNEHSVQGPIDDAANAA